MDVGEITAALEQLSRYAHYRGPLVVSIAEDGRVVTMRDGTAHVSHCFHGGKRAATTLQSGIDAARRAAT